MECLKNSSTSKPVAINCLRHGTPYSDKASKTLPEHSHPSTASASADKYSPSPPTTAQAAEHHTKPPYPDPWACSEQAGTQYSQTYTSTSAPQPQRQPQQEPPCKDDTQSPHSAPDPTPPPSSQQNGWYKQTFRCRWCESEKVYQGHGNWPFAQALQDGWNKPASRPWAGRASCKDCTTKYYGSTAAAHHVPLPTPTLASPQPASFSPW